MKMKGEIRFPVTVKELRKAQAKYEESLSCIERVRLRRFHRFQSEGDDSLNSSVGDLLLSIVVDKCGEDKECFVNALSKRSQQIPCLKFLSSSQIDLIWGEVQEVAKKRRQQEVLLEDGVSVTDIPFPFRERYFPPDPPPQTFEQRFIGRRA